MTSLSILPTIDQERWNQIYKAAHLVIILLYMRTVGDRPVTQSEIAENFQIARNTAAQKLRQLAHLGAIYKIGHNDGYAITDGGRQMLLAFDEPGCSNFEHPSLKESFNNDLKDNDSKDMKERKKGMLKIMTKERILSETEKLFPGHEVICFGLDDKLDPEFIIAWLAQAYDQYRAGKISHPWALVYRRLQTNRTLPDRKYQADPLSYLPTEFLVALDLEDPAVLVLDLDPGPDSDIVRIIENTNSVDVEIYNVWMEVQAALRKDMPKASFDTWVRDSYPIGYENKLLTIAARNLYAADWLKSRITSTVQRMLIGILGADVRVEFVVHTEEEWLE